MCLTFIPSSTPAKNLAGALPTPSQAVLGRSLSSLGNVFRKIRGNEQVFLLWGPQKRGQQLRIVLPGMVSKEVTTRVAHLKRPNTAFKKTLSPLQGMLLTPQKPKSIPYFFVRKSPALVNLLPAGRRPGYDSSRLDATALAG
jgi:hypothetical protein